MWFMLLLRTLRAIDPWLWVSVVSGLLALALAALALGLGA